jgi:hypothetical protein
MLDLIKLVGGGIKDHIDWVAIAALTIVSGRSEYRITKLEQKPPGVTPGVCILTQTACAERTELLKAELLHGAAEFANVRTDIKGLEVTIAANQKQTVDMILDLYKANGHVHKEKKDE